MEIFTLFRSFRTEAREFCSWSDTPDLAAVPVLLLQSFALEQLLEELLNQATLLQIRASKAQACDQPRPCGSIFSIGAGRARALAWFSSDSTVRGCSRMLPGLVHANGADQGNQKTQNRRA